MSNKPTLHTSISPSLLHLYDLSRSTVVIIDVFRATSTIAAALYNGARCVIPVDSVPRAIEISKNIDGIAAGERDGMIAEGLQHGNSPLEYSREFIENKTLVLTTTNGTRLLQMALDNNADITWQPKRKMWCWAVPAGRIALTWRTLYLPGRSLTG